MRAIDLYMNVEQEPAVWEWIVASAPLEPPVIEQVPPEISEGPPYTFTFSAPPDVPNATFECRLTPGSWFHGFEPCTSPHSYGDLVEGEYIFEVRVVNEYGIAGEIPAEYEFEVAIPPDTTILHGPSGETSSNTAAFAFASSEQGSTFICWLDGEELGECLSPAMFPDAELGFPEITPGTHTFEVQAEDIHGQPRPHARHPDVDGRRGRRGAADADRHGSAGRDAGDLRRVHVLRQRGLHVRRASSTARLPWTARRPTRSSPLRSSWTTSASARTP